MAHDLCEKTAGLASRVNNLAVNQTGNDSRRLLEEQDRLRDLTLVAIVKDLNEEHKDYIAAMSGIDSAMEYIGDADKKIDKVAKAITLVKKAADLVEKALKLAVK